MTIDPFVALVSAIALVALGAHLAVMAMRRAVHEPIWKGGRASRDEEVRALRLDNVELATKLAVLSRELDAPAIMHLPPREVEMIALQLGNRVRVAKVGAAA